MGEGGGSGSSVFVCSECFLLSLLHSSICFSAHCARICFGFSACFHLLLRSFQPSQLHLAIFDPHVLLASFGDQQIRLHTSRILLLLLSFLLSGPIIPTSLPLTSSQAVLQRMPAQAVAVFALPSG